jgi:hypothetical protein
LSRKVNALRKILDAVLWLFIAPGELFSDLLGVMQEQNRDLVRMLINSLFWIMVVIVGLAIWTNDMPMYL